MPKGILERLSEGVLLGDGGYLLKLGRRSYVQAGPFVPEVSLTRPEALAELHSEFVRARRRGVIQTLTFYASEHKLATVELEGRVDDINRADVRKRRGKRAHPGLQAPRRGDNRGGAPGLRGHNRLRSAHHHAHPDARAA